MEQYVKPDESLLYYKCDNVEFAKGHGQLFTEFENGIATRQINIINNEMYISSSLKDWNENIGFLLYDGHIDSLDLSDSVPTTRIEFENKWKEAILVAINKPQTSYLKGDASIPLEENTLIIHVVNILGLWGKGFVLSLSKQFPYAKKEYLKWSKDKETFRLGEVQFVCVDQQKSVFIANMLAQKGVRKNYKDSTTYIGYDALRSCLKKVARFSLINRLTIQMPKIGSGLAGGDWSEIEKIINEELIYYKIKCNVFEL
ncbi:macro domain-containing protein [Lysinibacillus mangiferihumi]|uniref:Macro domain-containing protein n=1 Tax=Lysinibacillus mangiferihumi TaxID=1130819 RepID=A0A4U2Z6B3_9BACI|nr:macro domain-containing protein [Lysinibacillus mangiferihumi]TKI69474.1 macro domain-containing protein [Lysinibacillus mangiferihumi]